MPLPGGLTAFYDSNGLGLYYFVDWLGSVRLLEWPNRTPFPMMAYAPFGEGYGTSTPNDDEFTAGGYALTVLQPENQGGTLDDFMFRRYNPTQGRWISPDPAGLAAVDPTNPQSWNRYAYVGNRPMTSTDPSGLRSGPYLQTPTIDAATAAFYSGADFLSTFIAGTGNNGVVMGMEIFDAIQGAPGTSLNFDMYGNLGWGFSVDLWILAENFMDQSNANLQAKAAVAAAQGMSLTWDQNPVLTVLVRDFGTETVVSGLIPDYLQLQADRQWLLSQMTPKEAAFFNLGRPAPSLYNSQDPRAVYLSGFLSSYDSAMQNYTNEFTAVYGVNAVIKP